MYDKNHPEFNSDLIVEELNSLGLEYITLNPGATTRGIHDSIVNYGGNKNPKLILCCHEEIAVAIASGYFRATGKPMAVLLHDTVGLMHATKAIFDAWIDRDAVVLIGGNGPIDIERRRPWIDWMHNALIPNTLVRDYVKWDDQPSDITSILEDLIRAYYVASAEPAGPVYLSIDAGLQEDRIKKKNTHTPTPCDFSAPSLDEGSIQSIESTGKALLEAHSPVVVVDKYGKSDRDVAQLVELAEMLGVAILDTGARFNFPSNHPMNLSGVEEDTLARSDMVLALGTGDLYFHLARKEKGFFSRKSNLIVKPECKIFRIDLEGLSISSWATEYGRLTPTALYVSARPSSFVASLLRFCGKELKKTQSRNRELKERREAISERSRKIRNDWFKVAGAELTKNRISYPGLALVIKERVKDEDWVLAFPGYSSRGLNAWLRRTWDITKYYQYPGRGAGTGTGTGQALGVALANKGVGGRLCIDFQPDGDLLYSASSLWTASNSRIPILIIMLNNRTYYNDEEHNKFIALERRRSDESSKVGIRIEDPNVDFAQLARSYGLKSANTIENYDGLREAVQEGVYAVTRSKVPFLIDVLVQPR